MAVAELDGHLSQRIVVEPELLQVRELSNLHGQFHNIVETQVEPDQVRHGKDFWQHLVQVHLRKVQRVGPLCLGHPCANLIMLTISFVRREQLVRSEVSRDHSFSPSKLTDGGVDQLIL